MSRQYTPPSSEPNSTLPSTTVGAIRSEARRFFSSVVAERAASGSLVADELSFQHLHSGQHQLMWRRRITTFLRICVASLLVGRIRVAQGGSAPSRGERRARRRVAEQFQLRMCRAAVSRPEGEQDELPEERMGSGLPGLMRAA